MLIEAKLTDGNLEIIYSEHKWDAPCLPSQLQDYHEVAKRKHANARLVFVGRSLKQRAIARDTKLAPEGKPLDGSFLWEEVFQLLDAVPETGEIHRQFLNFMKTHGLNPGNPLSPAGLVALLDAPKAKLSIERAIERLSEMDWGIVPTRYRVAPEIIYEKWGCTNLVMADSAWPPGWRPAVSIGFLLDTVAHAVALTNPAKGIDLMLRLVAPPDCLRSALIEPALVVLEQKLPELKRVAGSALLIRQQGNGNPGSLLMVQTCLADVISGATTESDQHEKMYQVLSDWLSILFGDGTLEPALIASGLVSQKPTPLVTSSPPACAAPTRAPAAA